MVKNACCWQGVALINVARRDGFLGEDISIGPSCAFLRKNHHRITPGGVTERRMFWVGNDLMQKPWHDDHNGIPFPRSLECA